MTTSKSKRKTAPRSRQVKGTRSRSSKRPNSARIASSALDRMRTGTKNAQVIAMLQDLTGATLASIMAATAWQQHSVRGFLSGTIGKKMGLTITSTKGEDGERNYSTKA